MLANNHLGHSLGDHLFNALGISPWTKKNQTGLHLSVILGLVLLVVGIIGTKRFYRHKFPKVLSWIIIGCIFFIIIFPIATEKVTFLFKYDKSGLESLDYAKRESRCNFQSEGNKVKANCSFTIFNYGKEGKVTIKPILSDNFADIDFETRGLILQPHTKVTVGVEFSGYQICFIIIFLVEAQNLANR